MASIAVDGTFNSNGNISFGGGFTTFSEDQTGFQSGLAKICPFWDDYNFTGAAGASLTKFDNGSTITVAWNAVPEYATTGTSNTFTCTMVVATGDIVLTYGAMSSLDGLTGSRAGNGVAATVFGPRLPRRSGASWTTSPEGAGLLRRHRGRDDGRAVHLPGDGHERREQPRHRPTLTFMHSGPTSYTMF